NSQAPAARSGKAVGSLDTGAGAGDAALCAFWRLWRLRPAASGDGRAARPQGKGAARQPGACRPCAEPDVAAAAAGTGLGLSQARAARREVRSEEHTSELQSLAYLVC